MSNFPMFMYFGRASRTPKKSRVALGRGQGKLLASVSSLSLSPSPWTPASCEVAAFECEKGVTNLPCANLAEILSGPTGRLPKPLTSNWTQLGWKIFLFCFVNICPGNAWGPPGNKHCTNPEQPYPAEVCRAHSGASGVFLLLHRHGPGGRPPAHPALLVFCSD